ncbi:hypothetical protein HYH02_002593 [Chlamydomonas schloesseri]|uniref:Mitochondrial fission 1 protein n=1 Tax=Chlamydomonas schloesseri TaxID=2026947 RepID=A0A835WVK0_9CHLO|nr:hypothetical protein HYH02_002593 [Chlamydomonas schloesseri]|eukprot:KAG2453270.1 hypothetical protein HYH02_002593 [Chlamydomonas schloesseri]
MGGSGSGSGAEHLPTVDLDLVEHADSEYRSIFQTGSAEEVEAARFRLIWALAHSSQHRHQARGLELCRTSLQGLKPPGDREYRYLAAVAAYKMGQYIEARRELAKLLQEQPGFRQAEFLRGLTEDAIVREGLLGVGIGAAVAGVALALLFGAGRK